MSFHQPERKTKHETNAPLTGLVRIVGFEPTRSCEQGILSPWRLPVPPYPHKADHSRPTALFIMFIGLTITATIQPLFHTLYRHPPGITPIQA